MDQPLRNLQPVPPAPPLGGTPPPTYAGALHSTVRDQHGLLAAWNAFLQEFRPTFILGADGRKYEVPVRTSFRAESTNHHWFGCNDITEGDVFKIRVNPGVLAAADTAGIDSDPPTIAALSKEYPVAGGDFTVVDGSKVYLKITTTSTDATYDDYSSEGGDTNGPEGGDGDDEGAGLGRLGELLTVETTVKSRSWTATAGEIIVQTGEATSDADFSYRLLAEIEITDGTMIIKQRHDGSVSVPSVSAAYGADPVLTGETDEHDLCNAGVAETHLFLSKFVD